MRERELRKKRITARRQEQILEAAKEVFSRKGYAAATVAEIAKLAGIAIGTLYLYYPSKRELFVAVIQDFYITPFIQGLIGQKPQTYTAATLKDIMKDRLELTKNDSMIWMFSMMGDIQRDPELKALWAQQLLHNFMSNMEGLCRGLTKSCNRCVTPTLAARVVGGLIMGFLMLRTLEGEASPVNQMSQDEVADALAGFVFRGLINDTGKQMDKGK
jgi:AcrR family transcriptional regulator